MKHNRDQNIAAAQELFSQVSQAGLSYGCVNITLTALGARFTLDEIDRKTKKETSSIEKLIEKFGLKVNWVVSTDAEITAEDIQYLFFGHPELDENYPEGEIVGYLWTETFPDIKGHAMAIFPEGNRFIVVDSETAGTLVVTAEQLANATQYVRERNGQFEIAQIRKEIKP